MADERNWAANLLAELDTIARDVCHYDYGLPLANDEAMPRIVDVIDAAIREAVAAERAKWVSACWKAFNDGYSEQGWTVIHEMGAAGEVPKL